MFTDTTSARRVLRIAVFALIVSPLLVGGPGCKGSSHRKKKLPQVGPGALTINEVVANANIDHLESPSVLKDEFGNPIVDADGEAVDWVEVYNNTNETLRLRRITLSNDAASPKAYRFPSKMKLLPGKSVVVICDGRPGLGPLHAPFTLDAAGETLRLYSKNGKVALDEKTWVNLPSDTSTGRFPDGDEPYGLIYVATPVAPNLPIGVKKPRVASDAQIGPVAAGSDDQTPLAVEILEDRELLSASVEVHEVLGCGVNAGAGEGDGAGNGGDDKTPSVFALTVADELTRTVVEDRRDYLDQPIQVDVQVLTLAALLPHFEPGTRLEVTFRLENVMGVTQEIQCREVVGGEQVLRLDPVAWVEPRCPAANEPARVTTFAHVDEGTVSAGIPGNFAASLTFRIDGGTAEVIDESSGLAVRVADPCELECRGIEDVAGTTALRIDATIPGQAAGALVTFSFEARDLVRNETDILDESPGTATTSLRYLSGYQAPDIVFNEVLPMSVTVLEELYSDDDRNAPGFEPPDFAELYNPGDVSLDVGGMFLARSRSASCSDDGSDCPGPLIRAVRGFELPDVSIPPKEFLLFLFVDETKGNTLPVIAGTKYEGKTVVVSALALDDCQQTLHLMSSDDEGNCPVTSFTWDFRASPASDECASGDFAPDTPLGSLPDGAGEIFELDPPTPGESNCIHEAPELNGDVEFTVDQQSDICVDPETDTLSARLEVLVAWREVILNPDELGVGAIRVLVDGEEVPAMPTVTESAAPGVPLCRVLLEIRLDGIALPPTGASASVAIEITDTRGSTTVVGPLPFDFDRCPEGPLFIRGDANLDATLNVTDLVHIVRRSFEILPDVPCEDAFDSNDDGIIDLADFTYLAAFMFERGAMVPAPFPLPGSDPTDDSLDCAVGLGGDGR